MDNLLDLVYLENTLDTHGVNMLYFKRVGRGNGFTSGMVFPSPPTNKANKMRLNWQHNYPLNEEHKLTGLDCICNPKIDWKDNLVIHNSFDNRGIIEKAKEITNMKPTGEV